MTDLTGQVALVTGASRGIGAATAQALAAAGAHVVLTGRDTKALEAIVDKRKDSPDKAESAADKPLRDAVYRLRARAS